MPTVLYSCAVCSYIFIRVGLSLSGIPLPVSLSSVCNTLNNYLEAILLCSLIADVFFSGITKGKVAFGIAGAIFVHVVSGPGTDETLRYAFLFILAYPKSCALRCVARCIWITYYSIIAATIIAFFCGYAQDVVTYEHGLIRHSFGFGSPNHLAVITTIATFSFLYDASKSWHVCYIPFVLGILLFVYSVTNGRMSLVLGAAFLVVTSISHIRYCPALFLKVFYCVAKWILPSLLVLCLAFTVLWSISPDLFGYDFIGAIFSGRPAEMVSFYDKHGFGFFGQDIVYVPRGQAMVTGETIMILDNAYAHMAIQYGLLVSLSAVLLFSLTAKKAEERRDSALSQYIVFIALFGISECVILDASFNLAVFAIGAMLANEGEQHLRN